VTLVLGISLALLILVLATVAGIWYVVGARKQTTASYSLDVGTDKGPEEPTTGVTDKMSDAVTGSQSCDTDVGEQGFDEAVFATF
jgi:hypothetical protein